MSPKQLTKLKKKKNPPSSLFGHGNYIDSLIQSHSSDYGLIYKSDRKVKVLFVFKCICATFNCFKYSQDEWVSAKQELGVRDKS